MFWHETNLTASQFILIGLLANGMFGATVVILNLLLHRLHLRNHSRIEDMLRELKYKLEEPRG